MGAEPLGFATLQPFGVYPWQANVLPGDGSWPTPGVCSVAAPVISLSSREPHATL